MGVTITQVDAFTSEPFSGNPAAVCLLTEPAGDAWMATVAREMNLSETAFLRRRPSGDFGLRWFTPAVEVELCGHATLASAHVLWEAGHVDRTQRLRFATRSGLLSAESHGDWIELDFPAEADRPATAPPGLVEALGIEPRCVGQNRFDYLVEVASEAMLRGMTPDFTRLRQVDARGTIVTSRATSDGFVSRFFAPAAGIDEDPVTGSAHCCLGPYWQRHLDRSEFTAFQASARGGVVRAGAGRRRPRAARGTGGDGAARRDHHTVNS